MATHSNIFAWRIPWIEEPGGLQSYFLDVMIIYHIERPGTSLVAH